MKNFNIFGAHGKIRVLGGGVHEKPIYRGDCLKTVGGLDSLQIEESGVGKKEGGGGGDTPMHTK